MAEFRIERLSREHVRQAFSCGKSPFDEFIRHLVGQYEKRNLGRTFVAVRPDEKQVLDYFTLASGAIPYRNLPGLATKKLPKHPVPSILIARLGVDSEVQGRELGAALLIDALGRGLGISEILGVHAIEVDSIDGQASAFYRKYGFVPLLDDETHLFLPIATAWSAFKSP